MASAASTGAAAAIVIRIKPRISNFTIRPATLVAATRGPSLLAATAGGAGALVSYVAFDVTSTTFTVQRPLAGRRRGRNCVKPTSHNRTAKRCTRYVNLGSFTRAESIALGKSRFRFTGRVAGRRLKPGHYRLQAIARNSGGTGPPAFAQFSVKR
ncbi:MAG: hypothetical protein QOI03_547 [Solirubrobacteraceae bacterium]|jgi:hypothetical protein|nr:hypothetical protein [Solirubrobacteraceae bacterium]